MQGEKKRGRERQRGDDPHSSPEIESLIRHLHILGHARDQTIDGNERGREKQSGQWSVVHSDIIGLCVCVVVMSNWSCPRQKTERDATDALLDSMLSLIEPTHHSSSERHYPIEDTKDDSGSVCALVYANYMLIMQHRFD